MDVLCVNGYRRVIFRRIIFCLMITMHFIDPIIFFFQRAHMFFRKLGCAFVSRTLFGHAFLLRTFAMVCMVFFFLTVYMPSTLYEGTLCGLAKDATLSLQKQWTGAAYDKVYGDCAFAASIQSRYNGAKADLAALQADAKRASYRDQWLRIERVFLELLRDAKAEKWNNTAAIAYRVAIIRDELARRSFTKTDYSKAAESYEDMARLFPRSVLADDAMLSAALLHANKLGDVAACKALLRRLVNQYPQGDMAPTARAILNGADETIFPPHRWIDGVSPLFGGVNESAKPLQNTQKSESKQAPTSKPETVVQKPNTSPPPYKQQSGPALPASKLRHVSWHNGPSIGTVLLDLSREARWRHQFVAGDAARNVPPRLYIDIDNCRMGGPSVSRGDHVGGSILQAVRVDTSIEGHLRIVIDFNAIHSYEVQVEHRNGYALRIMARNTQVGSTGSTGSNQTVVVPSQGQTGNKSQQAITPTAPPKDIVEQLGLGIHTIMIDAGHGGKDPGAIGNGLRESYIVMDMAQRIGKALKAHGFNVIYTRSSDVFIELNDRTRLANDRKADLFISLHVNASTTPSTNGIETYYYASTAYSNSAAKVAARENGVKEKQLTETQLILTDLALGNKTIESEGLAKKIQASMLQRLKKAGYTVRDNGVRSAPFYVLMGARMPAVLVEIGYCSNKEEAKRLASSKYRDFITQGIVQGIVDYKKSLTKR